MEEKRELQPLMERLERSNERQAKYAKGMFILSGLAALCCVAALAAVLWLAPHVSRAAQQVDAISGQLAVNLENLEVVTDQLAEADLAGMVRDVDDLAVSTRESVSKTMEKLDAIDFDALNRAIQDLADVVEPLAKFFGVFSR